MEKSEKDTADALALVAEERRRQRAKWGNDDLPTVDPSCVGEDGGPLLDFYDQPPADAGLLRSICDLRARVGTATMADVLNEEVAELYEAVALHGDDSPEAEAEAVQVAAVAVRIAEGIRRRRAASAPAPTPAAPAEGWDGNGSAVR